MTDEELLDLFLEAVAPFVSEAARAAAESARGTGTGMVRIYPSPVHVDMVYRDVAGHERIWRAEGTSELADVLARFLNEGVNALPEPRRGEVRGVVSAGVGQLIAIVDIRVGTASGVLVGADSTLEPDIVFVRRREDVLH